MPRGTSHVRPGAGRLATGLLVALLAAVAGCRPTPPPPVLIVVTIDTLRADRADIGMPSLKGLAARGTRFSRAYSPSSSTAPSHASIFTGLRPSGHSVGTANGTHRLVESETTLAEILRARGFATAAVVSNPVLERELGLNQGFDSYDDRLEERELNRPDRERRADRAVDLALARLDELAGHPFFLWLHLQDPHGPYTPPARWSGAPAPPSASDPLELPAGGDLSGHRAIPAYQVVGDERRFGDYNRRYSGEVAFADGELGRLLGRLRADPRLAGAVLIVTGDHGEAFGEDDYYFAHSHSASPDQVRVPLVVAGAGVPAGRVVDTPVGGASIFRTALDLLGIPAPEGSPASPSLAPLLRGDRAAGDAVVIESDGQTGVALGDLYATRDRRPSDDLEFWARNPTTGGHWHPLGDRAFDLAAGTIVPPPAPISSALDRAAAERAAAEERLAPTRRPRPSRPGLEQDLRAIGYVR